MLVKVSPDIKLCNCKGGGVPYWGCAAPKGHFLSPDSLVKGVPVLFKNSLAKGILFLQKSLAKGNFWRKPHKIGILGLNYRLFLKNFT